MLERSEIDINQPYIKHLTDYDTLKMYLEEGLDPNYSSGFYNLLFSTVSFPDRLKLVLEAGAFPNYQDIHGTTALHFACMLDCLECISILIDYGADPSIRENTGRTPYDYCSSNEARELIVEKMNQLQSNRILESISVEARIDERQSKKRKM